MEKGQISYFYPQVNSNTLVQFLDYRFRRFQSCKHIVEDIERSQRHYFTVNHDINMKFSLALKAILEGLIEPVCKTTVEFRDITANSISFSFEVGWLTATISTLAAAVGVIILLLKIWSIFCRYWQVKSLSQKRSIFDQILMIERVRSSISWHYLFLDRSTKSSYTNHRFSSVYIYTCGQFCSRIWAPDSLAFALYPQQKSLPIHKKCWFLNIITENSSNTPTRKVKGTICSK